MQKSAFNTDNGLLRALTRDDQHAFAEIYERYWKLLYQYAYNILRSEEHSKDCVQEVFAALWERRKKAAIESLEAWLKGAVRFQALTVVQARKVDHDFYKRVSVHLENIFVAEPFRFRELELLFHDVIDSLPPDQRQIFSMSRDQGLNYAQIAQRLNISVKTVEKKISQTLRRIRVRTGGALHWLLIILPALFN